MPGIAGVISRRPVDASQHLVDQMIASMLHEKFYTSGTYSVPELGLCAGWAGPPDAVSTVRPSLGGSSSVAVLLAGECFPDQRPDGTRDGFDSGDAAWLASRYE